MTSKEFVLWLKGFTEGVHEFNITPKQWDILKEKLAGVNDQTYPFGNPFGTPNGTRGPETPTGTTITTTPGTGYITVANPYIASFGDISTSTSTSLPSGSTISYTTSKEKTLLND
jgi:hypothetical protein